MAIRYIVAALGILGCLMATSHRSRAQEYPGMQKSHVAGRGVATVERTPTILRSQVMILAKGPNITEAMLRFKNKKTSALRKLEKLGAVKESIVATPPFLGHPASEEHGREMEMMMMRRMKMMSKEKGAAKAEPIKQTFVWCMITAEWKLEEAELDIHIRLTDAGCNRNHHQQNSSASLINQYR